MSGLVKQNLSVHFISVKCALIEEILDMENGESASAAVQPESLAQTAVPPGNSGKIKNAWRSAEVTDKHV